MPTYVMRNGQMVDKATGEPMLTDEQRAGPVPTPQVYGDLPGYRSPIDGKWVEGRRARKYDLESNGCVDANEVSSGPKKLKNKRFIEKRGLQHLSEQ